MVQTQEGEMVEAGREGGIMTHEKSVPEVGRPYFVTSKWEEESGGVDEESVQVTKKNMDVFLRKVRQLSEMTVNSSKLLSEVLSEKRSEKNVGVNPEEVVQVVADNSYDSLCWSEAACLLTLPVRLGGLCCQSCTDGGLLYALLEQDHQVLEPCEQ